MDVGLDESFPIIRSGFTEDEYYRLANEDCDWEYIDGDIIMHSPASNRHEDLFRFLLTILSAFLDEVPIAIVRGSRYPMRLDKKWSPEPDLMAVRSERAHLAAERHLDGPADLAIEIVSKSDKSLVYRKKLPRYRKAEIPEIWIVDPLRGEVLVETRGPAGISSRKVSAGRIESRIIPGFWIDAGWLWARKLPSTFRCLQEILARIS